MSTNNKFLQNGLPNIMTIQMEYIQINLLKIKECKNKMMEENNKIEKLVMIFYQNYFIIINIII